MRIIRGLTVAAGGVALAVLAASPAAAGPLFCGAGRGLTAEVAIQGAFWDAQGSAQSEGYYGACTIVGEPQMAAKLSCFQYSWPVSTSKA